MSDLTPNFPDNNPINNSGSNDDALNYELITAYIDNEIKDDNERERIKKLIETDNNIYNRYIFEKLTKENFQKRNPKLETPVYVYKHIGQQIDDYIKKASVPKTTRVIDPEIFSRQIRNQKSNLRRNLIYSSVAFILLVGAAFLFNSFLKKNPELSENDLVAVSRKVFDKVDSGKVPLQFKSDNPKTLEDSMEKNLDFDVFIPDLEGAVLVGGVCNEINGEKTAHIIHMKGNVLIYTLEVCKKEVMNNQDKKIILCEEFKKNINEGKNWVACTKDKNRTTVIWYKDDVICSSVSPMESQDLVALLSHYK